MNMPLAEADRRIANIIQLGVVTALDTGAARAKVQIGDLTTPFIPIAALSAGAIQFWWAPSVGEQVVVAAPSGDMAQAVIVCSIFAGNAPSGDGAVPMINLNGGKMTVNGDIIVSGDVIASGVSLVNHTHKDVMPGSANTGVPNK